MTTREALRTATVGSPSQFRSKIVEFNENKFEVRELTPAARENIRRKSENQVLTHKDGSQEIVLDHAKYVAYLIIETVFVPGTDVKVFEPGDVSAILNTPTSGFYSTLGDAASEVQDAAVEEGNE